MNLRVDNTKALRCAGQRPGTVYLVGAGPGDPKLITVRGLEVLRRADAVVYDALVNPALLGEAPASAECIYAGKRAGRHAARQEEINELLRALAQEHAVVVRLKAGDPYVFGRGGEERSYLLERNVPVEVVPGISSAIAAPGAAGVPLTQRGVSSSFAVVTGRVAADAAEPRWDALAQLDTLIIMMGLGSASDTARRLMAAGRPPETPALIVVSATLPEQQAVVTTLAGLGEAAALLETDGPVTIVVGAVSALAPRAGASPAALVAGMASQAPLQPARL